MPAEGAGQGRVASQPGEGRPPPQGLGLQGLSLGRLRSAVSVSVCDGMCECLSVWSAVCTQRQHV